VYHHRFILRLRKRERLLPYSSIEVNGEENHFGRVTGTQNTKIFKLLILTMSEYGDCLSTLSIEDYNGIPR